MFENFIVEASYKSDINKKHEKLKQVLSKHIEVTRAKELEQETLRNQKLNIKLENGTKSFPKSQIYHTEETFEFWHNADNLNQNLKRLNKRKSSSRKYAFEKTDAHQAKKIKLDRMIIDEEPQGSSIGEIEQKQDVELFTEFDTSSSWTKAQFSIKTKGLEVLPSVTPINLNDENSQSEKSLSIHLNFTKYHITILKVLLHINMLKKKWNIAYKIFCVIIRCNKIDIRSIWPLGIEIIKRQREMFEIAKNPNLQDEENVNSKETALKYLPKDKYLTKTFKDELFFEWLSSFYPTQRGFVDHSKHRQASAPIWRSGSKTHTPLYITTALWDLFIKKEYKAVEDKLSELLLEPPYDTDGVFYFMRALTKHIQVSEFVKSSEKLSDGSKQNGLRLLKEAQVLYCKSSDFSFEYPSGMINSNLLSIKKRLLHEDVMDGYENDDNDTNVNPLSDETSNEGDNLTGDEESSEMVAYKFASQVQKDQYSQLNLSPIFDEDDMRNITLENHTNTNGTEIERFGLFHSPMEREKNLDSDDESIAYEQYNNNDNNDNNNNNNNDNSNDNNHSISIDNFDFDIED